MSASLKSAPSSLKGPDECSPKPYHRPYRWIILLLVWLLYLSYGVVSRSASPLVTPILEDLNMSYSQMGFVLGSWQLTYMFFALLAGFVLDRWGLRKSLFVGSMIIALSAAMRYFATGFSTFFPIVAVFGVGGTLISIGSPKAISVWFRGKDRGTAVGIYTTGPWIGQMFVMAGTNAIVMPLTGYSWRLTFVYYGLFALLTAILWWIFAEDIGPASDRNEIGINRVIGKLLTAGSVRVILMAGLLTFAILHGFISWLPKMLERAGLSSTLAGVYSALPYLISIPAVLIIPRMIPQRLMGRTIAVLGLIGGAAVFLIAASLVPLTLGLFLYGLAISPLVPLLVLILMETPQVGSEHMGTAGGMFFCISEIGGFFGPYIVGALVDLTGSFLAGAAFLALLGCGIFGLMFLLNSER